MDTRLIELLTELAGAEDAAKAERLLYEAHALLGENAGAYSPLLATLVTRARESALLKDLAARDPLTGIANRRTFDEVLRRELARQNRHGHRVSVVLVDLDGLKEINDRHGHGAGDMAIIGAASALEESLRGCDLVARLGGDEFGVLLPDTEPVGAYIVAERLRLAIEDRIVAGNHLRASVGVATAAQRIGNAQRLVAAADADLYRNKRERSGLLQLPAA